MADTMNSTIALALQFSPLARRPDIRRFGRRWDVCIEVDGVLRIFEEGPHHCVAVAPGPHTVRVWFRGAGIAVLARWVRFGLRSVDITVDAGATVNLIYQGTTFWHMGGGAKLVVV